MATCGPPAHRLTKSGRDFKEGYRPTSNNHRKPGRATSRCRPVCVQGLNPLLVVSVLSYRCAHPTSVPADWTIRGLILALMNRPRRQLLSRLSVKVPASNSDHDTETQVEEVVQGVEMDEAEQLVRRRHVKLPRTRARL